MERSRRTQGTPYLSETKKPSGESCVDPTAKLSEHPPHAPVARSGNYHNQNTDFVKQKRPSDVSQNHRTSPQLRVKIPPPQGPGSLRRRDLGKGAMGSRAQRQAPRPSALRETCPTCAQNFQKLGVDQAVRGHDIRSQRRQRISLRGGDTPACLFDQQSPRRQIPWA